MNKKITKSGWMICVAALLALIGMIIYIVTSTTGYLASASVNKVPIICSIAAVILMAVLVFAERKLKAIPADLCVVLANVLLIVSFAKFCLSRVTLAADVYFIPVNYPQSEETTLNNSIVGVVFYLLAIILMIVVAFAGKKSKK